MVLEAAQDADFVLFAPGLRVGDHAGVGHGAALCLHQPSPAGELAQGLDRVGGQLARRVRATRDGLQIDREGRIEGPRERDAVAVQVVALVVQAQQLDEDPREWCALAARHPELGPLGTRLHGACPIGAGLPGQGGVEKGSEYGDQGIVGEQGADELAPGAQLAAFLDGRALAPVPLGARPPGCAAVAARDPRTGSLARSSACVRAGSSRPSGP